MSVAIFTAVFLTGLLGGVHCAGMCGGIVAALSGQAGSRRLPLHLAYNGGRVASYAAAGALAGAAGGLGLLLDGVLPVQLALYVLANLMLIALGLYLAGVSSVVAGTERLGLALWRRIQPLTRGLLPADTLPRALGLGVLWGWLPCGLVYAVLATALLSGNPLERSGGDGGLRSGHDPQSAACRAGDAPSGFCDPRAPRPAGRGRPGPRVRALRAGQRRQPERSHPQRAAVHWLGRMPSFAVRGSRCPARATIRIADPGQNVL